jgi:outer membrane receptor for ferrienterochelin and colicins
VPLWPALAATALAEPASDAPCAREDATDCDPIVVTASRVEQAQSQTTAAVVVLDRARLESTGATTLTDALRAVPGIQLTPTRGGAAPSLRGMDPEHTLVLLDGRPLAGRVDGVVDLNRIAVADLERVEVLPGPASALYGSEAIGGVIHLVTRRGGAAPSVRAHARGGSRSLMEGGGSVAGNLGAVRAGASAYRNAQDGWDSSPSDPATNGDDALAWGTRAFAGWSPSTAWSFDADGDYGVRDTRGVRATGAGATFDTRALQETGDASVSARHWNGMARVVTGRIALSTWRQQTLDDQRGSVVQDAYQETIDRRVAANAQAQWATGRHVAAVGVDGWSETLDSDRIDTAAARRVRGALYAQDDWRVTHSGPRVSLAPGARVDLDSQFGVAATPSLAFRVDPAEGVTVRANVGRGYRAPDFKELYLALNHATYGYTLAGNPDLRPEHSVGGNLDVAATVADVAQVRARGSWDEVRDLIQPGLTAQGDESGAASYGYVNVGRARVRTIGAGVGWVAAGPFDVGADYLLTDATDLDTGTRLDGRAPHRVTARAGVRVGTRLDATTHLEWTSPRPYTLAGATTLGPPTTWVDARVAWAAPYGTTLEVGARNLLDARDDAFQGLPPRTLYVGIRGEPPLRTPREARSAR